MEGAARALAAEAGLEVVVVHQVHELDGDEDVAPVPEVPEVPEDVVPIPLADASEPVTEPVPEPDDDGDPERDDEAAREAERAREERRRAVLAETDAALAKGREWDELVAGR
ncbi:hypothetical protein [Isoptericola sp. NPDC057653]|uniref:hypothetical protein n=1 Tax=Isoptericola sp. NPDC057653 TaxID=3346195 RepID=UPI00367BEAB2